MCYLPAVNGLNFIWALVCMLAVNDLDTQCSCIRSSHNNLRLSNAAVCAHQSRVLFPAAPWAPCPSPWRDEGRRLEWPSPPHCSWSLDPDCGGSVEGSCLSHSPNQSHPEPLRLHRDWRLSTSGFLSLQRPTLAALDYPSNHQFTERSPGSKLGQHQSRASLTRYPTADHI
jgi:hypothetical protein